MRQRFGATEHRPAKDFERVRSLPAKHPWTLRSHARQFTLWSADRPGAPRASRDLPSSDVAARSPARGCVARFGR